MRAVEVALLSVGTFTVVAAALGVLLAPEPFARLHFLSPVSAIGVPLIATAVMLDQGHNRTTAKIAFLTIVIVAIQPALTAATGRALAEARGLVSTPTDGEA